MKNEPPNEEALKKQKKLVNDTLDKIEKVWLEDGKKKYIGGDKISVADIVACCELEQPSVAGFDVREGRPVLTEYMNRIRAELNPHYDEVHKILYMMKGKFASGAAKPKL
jgi:glutathione S-transferase